ncbi:MAG: VWA domain-containing protein, partial [Parcubacteria group bacterium]|nr:VWA domain-containing protein [Parcubacteria group bacterium]
MNAGKNMPSRRHPHGFSIVETLVATAIVAIGVIAGMALLLSILRANRLTAHEVVATNLAEEGVELVRNRRDLNIDAGEAFNEGLAPGEYILDADGTLSSRGSGACDAADILTTDFNLKKDANGRYSHTGGDPSAFYRCIQTDVCPGGSPCILARSVVAWRDPQLGARSVVSEAHIANLGIQARCGTTPLDIELVLDRSGSMVEKSTKSPAGSPDAKTRLEWLKIAVLDFLGSLNAPENGGVGGLGRHRVGVTTFQGSVITSLADAATYAELVAQIQAISSGSGVRTPFNEGMKDAAKDMNDWKRATDRGGRAVTHVMILLSDGNPDPDFYYPTQEEIDSFRNAVGTDGIVYGIAVGDDIDPGTPNYDKLYVDTDLISRLAKDPDGDHLKRFKRIISGDDIPGTFRDLFEEIACDKEPGGSGGTPVLSISGDDAEEYVEDGYTIIDDTINKDDGNDDDLDLEIPSRNSRKDGHIAAGIRFALPLER